MSDQPRRIMISAGEPSGDLHGAALAKVILDERPSWRLSGLGGDSMAAAGVELRAHMRETAVMGGTEVLAALPRILRVRSLMVKLITEERPDCLVLIDSPDFNFRLAKAAKAAGVPTVYYICPTVWAWRPGRLNFLRDYADARALLFGFEADFYRARGVDCDLVGHPLFDELPRDIDREAVIGSLKIPAGGPILALLPGSRRSVASRLARPMIGAADILLEEFGDLRIVVPRAASLPEDYLNELLSGATRRVKNALTIVSGRSQEVLAVSRAAMLASGTSSVEGAILGVPMVVAWRFSSLSWILAKLLIKAPYATIANIVAGREIVPELLQSRANPEELAAALAPLIRGGSEREAMLGELAEVARSLGGPGATSRVFSVIKRVLGGHAPGGQERLDAPKAEGSGPGGHGELEAAKTDQADRSGLFGQEPSNAGTANDMRTTSILRRPQEIFKTVRIEDKRTTSLSGVAGGPRLNDVAAHGLTLASREDSGRAAPSPSLPTLSLSSSGSPVWSLR